MDTYQKQFELRQENPAYWHSKSHDLLVSARTLWEAMQENRDLEINCWATYKMLMGMSFELLIKSHCVGAGIKFGQIHDLVALAKTANLTTSSNENKLLHLLSEYILWDGRYPIPKRVEHLKSHWTNQITKSDDETNFDNLFLIWRKFSDSFMTLYN